MILSPTPGQQDGKYQMVSNKVPDNNFIVKASGDTVFRINRNQGPENIENAEAERQQLLQRLTSASSASSSSACASHPCFETILCKLYAAGAVLLASDVFMNGYELPVFEKEGKLNSEEVLEHGFATSEETVLMAMVK
jgi:hypothetical protein